MNKISDNCQACQTYQNEGIAEQCPLHRGSKYNSFFYDCMEQIWNTDGISEALKFAREEVK
jgi:hypothetical protein